MDPNKQKPVSILGAGLESHCSGYMEKISGSS